MCFIQVCVRRSFETFNTVNYVLNLRYAYNTIVLFSRLGVPIFVFNGPDSSQNHPKRFQFCSIISYVIRLEARWKAVLGGNCPKRPKNRQIGKCCNRILLPNLFN